MDHLAQDLSVALEESEMCRAISNNNSKWGMRRRTRSAGNLHLIIKKARQNQSDESSSSNSEAKTERQSSKLVSFHQSDSDDMSFSITVAKALNQRTSLRMKYPLQRGVSHSLESDSVNEHSPAGPYFRRKRKLKRMSIDETPILPSGKRKRSQRLDMVENGRSSRHSTSIKPLHQSIVDKIEKICYTSSDVDNSNSMEVQSFDENCEVASESSISWSGGEGHEGDDELTDWAPTMENTNMMDQTSYNETTDPREIRAGCRRLGEERPGFSISTSANERVARFLRDPSKSELRLYGAEKEKLGQLATLYSLDLWFESSSSSLLRKTGNTPTMQPTQRHHSGLKAIHKKIRTHDHHMVS